MVNSKKHACRARTLDILSPSHEQTQIRMRHFTQETIQVIDLSGEPALLGVRILLFDTQRLPDDMVFEVGKLLSPQELRKSARFRFPKDRRNYLAGRGILRKMCSEILGKAGQDIVVTEGQYGKPYLKDHHDVIRFNMSNSGNFIAQAYDFSRQEIGVDVEVINKDFEYWDVAGHYFSKKECDRIYNHRDFYRYWTRKEALLKVTGVGLIDDLQLMDLSTKMNRVAVRDERLLPFRNKAFTLYTFDYEEIVVSLAVSGAHITTTKLDEVQVANVYFY